MSGPRSARVQQVLDTTFAIDCRDPSFLLSRFTGDEKSGYWDTLNSSGLSAVVVDAGWVHDGLRDTAISIGHWLARARHNRAVVVRSYGDLLRAKEEGRVAIVLSLQSPTAVEHDLNFVEVLWSMGIRVMQVAYQARNLVADGCGERRPSGYSKFGLSVLAEMNRMGMLVDLAHSSDVTMAETLEFSTQPVVNSHSGARALVDHPRNMPDDLILSLARAGGVFCVSAYSAFLRDGGGQSGTTLADYLRHVDHLLSLIGDDHIGVGFDVGEARSASEIALLHAGSGATTNPVEHRYVSELRSRRDYWRLVDAFIAAGYSDQTIDNILGGNLLRLFEKLWSETPTSGLADLSTSS